MAVMARVKKAAGGAKMFPEGFNRAILVSAEEHNTKNNSAIRLTLRNGDLEHREDLWLSEAAQARLSMFAKRLGLMSDDANAPAEIDVNFEDAVGNEYVIEVKWEQDQNEQTISKLSYGGLWSLGHSKKEVQAYLRTQAGEVAATAGDDAAADDGHGGGQNGTGNGSSNGNGNGKKPAASSQDIDDI
jgi:hypothetical protein